MIALLCVSVLIVLGMPDDLALNEVNHFFGDIGGMISEAFQVP